MPESSPASSVHCEGWWEQRGLGRQPMTNLELCFHQGHLTGSGTDVIGPFHLKGLLDEQGLVSLLKRYVGRHAVDYLGHYDGEGTLQGQWQLGFDSGNWLIRIKRQSTEQSSDIAEWTAHS